MARIAGVDLPNKATKIALTYIYGIGRTSAEEICKKTGVDPDARINTLSADVLAELRKVIENDYTVEGRLRTQVNLNIKPGRHPVSDWQDHLGSCRGTWWKLVP